jgi:hypothetical protein
MKTTLHKTLLFLFVTMFAMQVKAQRFPAEVAKQPGVYKIKVQSQDLYLTQSATSDIATYELEIPGSDAQLFVVNTHPDGDYFSITSKIPGKGALEALTTDVLTPEVGCKGNTAGGSGQQDKWNPTRGAGTQIFLYSDKTGTAWESTSALRRFQDYSLGATASLNGGTAVAFDWILVETLSTEDFDLGSFFMPNPVNSELAIQGLPANVKKVTVYSLLGQEILSTEVNSESLNINVSALKTGVYIVDFSGENGRFTKKIIKQ